MIQKKKINYYFIIVLILVFISVGYAYLNSSLKINGKSSIKKNVWDIHFENLNLLEGSVSNVLPELTATSITINTTLNVPGDYYGFSVNVVNSGTIGAIIDSVKVTSNITEEQAKYFNFSVLYADGSEIDESQILSAGDWKKLNVIIEFKKDINPSDLPQVESVIDTTIDIIYTQLDHTEAVSITALKKSWSALPGVSLYDAINSRYNEKLAEGINSYPQATEYLVSDIDFINLFIDEDGKILNLKDSILESGKSYTSIPFSFGSKVTEDVIKSKEYVTALIDVTDNVRDSMFSKSYSDKYIPVFVGVSDTYINVTHAIYPTPTMFFDPSNIESLEQEVLGEYILGFPAGQDAGCGASDFHSFFYFVDENDNFLKITDQVQNLEKRICKYVKISETEGTWEQVRAYVLELMDIYINQEGE